MIITGDTVAGGPAAEPEERLDRRDGKAARHQGIATVELERSDIVRHRLVQNIVNAYERHAEIILDLDFGFWIWINAKTLPRNRVQSKIRNPKSKIKNAPRLAISKATRAARRDSQESSGHDARPRDAQASGDGRARFNLGRVRLRDRAIGILMLRENVVPFRPGQWVPHDIVSRVDFVFRDEKRLTEAKRKAARGSAANLPRWPRRIRGSCWRTGCWCCRTACPARSSRNCRRSCARFLDAGARWPSSRNTRPVPARTKYQEWVKTYVSDVRGMNLVVLPDVDRREDVNRTIIVPTLGVTPIPTEQSYSPQMREEIAAKIQRFAGAELRARASAEDRRRSR
jgi:hypothetical protein